MSGSGILDRLGEAIINKANTSSKLIAATLCTNIYANAMAADQYLSIIITGRMYKNAYN